MEGIPSNFVIKITMLTKVRYFSRATAHGSSDFPALTAAEAGTRFSDPGGMQG